MKAILLIPAPGDPCGLLAPGKCGAMSPTRWSPTGENPDMRWSGSRYCLPDWSPDPSSKEALVLAWEGESVAEGCDRAARCLATRMGLNPIEGTLWRTGGLRDPNWTLQVGSQPVDRRWAITFGPWMQEPFNGVPHTQVIGLERALRPESLVAPWALATVCAFCLGGEVVVLPR